MSDYLIAHIGHSTKLSEHVVWWNPDEHGYTICIDKAGLYGESDALRICYSGLCIAVTKQTTQGISRGTPYYRQPNGELAPLYGGGEHTVVPNSKEAWKVLLARRLDTPVNPDRPTPIGAKARAIYLPKEKENA